MWRWFPLILLIAACSARPPEPPDPAEEKRTDDLEFLAGTWGYQPGEMAKERRSLHDLLDREDRMEGLRREETVEFGRTLSELTGYRFRPADARLLVAGASGPVSRALEAPHVRTFLLGLRDDGLLDPAAGRALLLLGEAPADALGALAADPAARPRIDGLAEDLGYRFLPTDAPALLRDRRIPDEGIAWLNSLLAGLGVEFRPAWWPEVTVLLAHRDRVDGLRALAEEADVTVRGPAAVVILARIAVSIPSMTAAERDRFRRLARRAKRPGTYDLLPLVRLAKIEGMPDLVSDLEDRYRYRFDPADGTDLIRLLRAGVPEFELPDWVRKDRLPLTHPGELLSDEPAAAFADRNDLRFMESLSRVRPALANRARVTLEMRIEKRLVKKTRQFRVGAPYSETEEELPSFRRPDLLKALLLLEELERPEVIELLVGWAEEDVRNRTSESGGYVRLTPGGRLRFDLAGAAASRDDRLHLPPDPEGSALDFHFHATDEDEAAWAGPSSGAPGTDLFRARFHRIDGLVITKLSGARINMDLYVSTGKTLDLGVYGR